MTNKQKWDEVTKDLESPNIYLELTWHFAVAAALERRVYFGDPKRAMLSNMYLLLVGPPAVGKGTCMRSAGQLLRRFMYLRPDGNPEIDRDTKEPRPLFQNLPDTVTFEKLAFAMAEIKRPLFVNNSQDPSKSYIYTHSSAYFMLEELSSLFRRQKSDDVARFLLNLYDGEPFKYSTRHNDTAYITNGCLNMIACTQLDFIRKAEQEGLLGEGLFSRFIIAYAEDRRQVHFHYADLTDTQKSYLNDLQLYIKSLSTLFGQVRYKEASTHAWLEDWWKRESEHLKQYKEGKLANYVSRRKDQLIKLAISDHFGESTSMEIGQISFDRAAVLVRTLEDSLITISRRTGKNQAFPIQERMLAYIRDGGSTGRDHAAVIREFEAECDAMATISILTTLQSGKRIEQDELTKNWMIPSNNDSIQETSS